MPLPLVIALSLLSAAPRCTGAVQSTGVGEAARSPRAIEAVEDIDGSRNVGFLILDLEHELLGDVVLLTPDRIVTFGDGYRTLGRLVERTKKRLAVDATTPLEPLTTLEAIDGLLAEEGFSYRDYSAPEHTLLGHHTLSFGLARRELDCAMYTYVYLTIAESLDLPLRAVSLPEHLALRWTEPDGSTFDWEGTVGKPCDDEFYLRWKHPSPAAVERGVYLRSLSKWEVLATALYEKGLALKERRRTERARIVTRLALELAPLVPDTHNLDGMLAAVRGDHLEALRCFDRALALDDTFAHALYNRAGSELALGRIEDARATLERLRRLAPSFAERLESRLEREDGPTSARPDRRPWSD